MSEYRKAVVVICTRPESDRLPRKAFKKIAGLPAIEHILRRLGTDAIPPFPVILAVPAGCMAYDHLAAHYGVHLFYGHPMSPLHRMADAVTAWIADLDQQAPKYVIRITHDDILIDAKTMVDLVDAAERIGAGYATTPAIVDGAGVEVIHVANLFKASEIEKAVEHVSYFVRGHGMPNDLSMVDAPRAEIARPYRLTMDYPQDAVVLEAVLRAVGPLAPLDDVCRYLDLHGEVLRHNAVPAVSVYICARNAGKWIQDAIRSVPQGCADGAVELVVVEDCSSDDTLTKIIETGDRVNRLIVNEDNMGLASASNIGLKNCRARYIMRLDADDRLKPGAIDCMLARIKSQSAGVVYAAYDEMNETGGVVTKTGCAPDVHHHAGSALMDAKMINELRFRDGLRHWDGLELYNRLTAARIPVAYYRDAALWFYRKHGESVSAKMTPDRKAALDMIEGFR